MKAVWKYDVDITDSFSLDMPKGAVPLTVAMQGETAKLWALVDPFTPLEARTFRLAGTGHDIKENIKSHVGTFQMYGGSLVFHLFEIDA